MFGRRDPVCGAKVNKNTKYSLEYKGKIYYFDCQACRTTFQEGPDGFIKKKSKNGFLKGLAKGSGEVPKSCHDMKNQ